MKQAIKCFEQALSLQPDYVDARIKLAQVLRELGRAEEALVQLEKVVDLRPDETEAHIILALTLRELGQAERAIERLERHLRTKPDCGALYYHIAMIEPKQEHIPVVEKLIGDPGLSNHDAVYCHFAVGNMLNGGKSYDQAFHHILKANALYRETFSYDTKEDSQIINRLIKVYSKRFFQRTHELGSASQLPVFILGMQKSGSTLVEQIISSHSQVHGADEIHALTTIETNITQQLESANPYPECMSIFDKGMAEVYSAQYLQELALHCPTAIRISDKLLGNFSRIGLIKTLFPKARIIHCQRNPLDNCISIFFQFFPELKCSFELTELGRYYLDYQRLMSHWHKLFPGEILDVQYEELVMDQEAISRQLIDYLGLEWDEKCLDFHNNKRDVRTSSNIQVRQPMYKNSMNRWKHYERHLQPLIEVLQQPL
jgi:tetratricopeptide (TPR) repeat protein